MKFVIPAPP